MNKVCHLPWLLMSSKHSSQSQALHSSQSIDTNNTNINTQLQSQLKMQYAMYVMKKVQNTTSSNYLFKKLLMMHG
jgi:uncharacterized protein YwgA